jgi:hypothetical protein
MCFDKMFKTWKDALLKPKQTFKKEKKNANLGNAVKQVFIAGIIAGIVSAFAEISNSVAILVSTPFVAVIGLLLGSGIYYVFARLLGGKSKYREQTYLIALYTAPLSIYSSIFSTMTILLASLGSLNFIIALPILIMFGLSIYGLYLLTLVLKEAHGLSTGRAVLAWLIPFLMVVVFAMIVAAVVALWVGGFASIPEALLI